MTKPMDDQRVDLRETLTARWRGYQKQKADELEAGRDAGDVEAEREVMKTMFRLAMEGELKGEPESWFPDNEPPPSQRGYKCGCQGRGMYYAEEALFRFERPHGIQEITRPAMVLCECSIGEAMRHRIKNPQRSKRRGEM